MLQSAAFQLQPYTIFNYLNKCIQNAFVFGFYENKCVGAVCCTRSTTYNIDRVLWVMVFENLPFLNEIKDYIAIFLLKFSKFQKKINKIQKKLATREIENNQEILEKQQKKLAEKLKSLKKHAPEYSKHFPTEF